MIDYLNINLDSNFRKIKIKKDKPVVALISKRSLGQDPTKLLNYTKCWVCNPTYMLLKQAVACIPANRVRGCATHPTCGWHKL